MHIQTCLVFRTCLCSHRLGHLVVMLILMLLATTIWREITTASMVAIMLATTYHRCVVMIWATDRRSLRPRQQGRHFRRIMVAEELLLLARRVLYGYESLLYLQAGGAATLTIGGLANRSEEHV